MQEKKAWKNAPDLQGVVETEFIRPIFTGDNVFPFRIGDPLQAVMPVGKDGLLTQSDIDLSPGLQNWWSQATVLWEDNRAKRTMTLVQRLDYQRTLSKQFPLPALRVVYNKSGMHICSAKLRNRRAIVAGGLYWATAETEQESDFLCALLNAPATTELTRPLMSYGKDERDIHKHVWELPIPLFDRADPTHVRIAELGAELERMASALPFDASLHFPATRRHIRDALFATETGKELNELAFELIA